MAAFARQQDPSAGVRHQCTNPKTCTGADDADWAARLRLRRSYQIAVGFREIRNRHCGSGEIIDNDE
jgi:hypothetical protein